MSFLSAGFLYALAAVGIPVVIHLIHRQRYPDRPFTTLRFFDKTVKNNTIQTRLIDKLLLLLRMIALAVIAFGLARPFISGSSGPGEARMSLVLVLDNSPSMARVRDGKTLFDRAQSVALAALDRLGPADHAELLFTAPTSDPVVFTEPADVRNELDLHEGQPAGLWINDDPQKLSIPGLTTDTERLKAAAAAAKPGSGIGILSYGAGSHREFGYDLDRLRLIAKQARIAAQPGDVKAALTRAAELLRTSNDGDRKIMLVSDLQKSEWEGETLSALAGLPLVVVPVEAQPDEGANLGIEACTLPVHEADFGQSITATASIRNYSAQKSDVGKLTVVCGDNPKPVELKVPPILPHSALTVAFPVQVMSRERQMLCSAHIHSPSDPFAYDDTWWFQVAVRFPVQTLCVNGATGRTGADSEAFYVMNALSSRSASNPAAADTKEVELADFAKRSLTEWNVIVLAGVERLDAAMREKIRQFAADGKSVLVFPSSGVAPEEYNGWGFLPAQLLEKKTKDFAYIKSVDGRARALAGFAQRAGAGLHALSASMRFVLQPSAEARVLARFSDGTPALVEGPVGKGHVILAAASAHASESDWPLRPAFVLLLRNLVKYLGADARPPALLTEHDAGEGAAVTIPPEMAGGTPAVFRAVTGSQHYEPAAWLQNGRSLLLPCAGESGHYFLSMQPGTEGGILAEPKLDTDMSPVCFNHSPRESDLASMSVDELSAKLPKSTPVSAYRAADKPETIVEALHTGREYWRWMMLAAAGVLACESLLAWAFASEAAA